MNPPERAASPRLDPAEDHHVHSTFSDDARSSPAENLAAAVGVGLRSIRMVDHVRASTTYVPEFVAAVDALRPQARAAELELLTGVEAKILDVRGAVDAPHEVLSALGTGRGADRVLLADHQFPGPEGPWSPREARRRLDAGLPVADAVGMLVEATCAAMIRVGRAQLAHLFSILPKVGLAEDDVTPELLGRLARTAAETGTAVEVNEKWRCPGARVRSALAGEGVRLVASTDAHDAAEVGRYSWLRATAGDA